MDSAIQDYRDFYARFIVACSGSSNERIVKAFSSIARERFLGDGPWLILAGTEYIPTVSNDPRHVYQDVVVGLIPEKKINNGQPSLHARCLAAVDPAPGETIVHIGAGTGYYTAILARLVGPAGVVHAYEIEESLADRARVALQSVGYAHVHCQNALEAVLQRADVIYINAGVTHIQDQWLGALRIGGRLVVPLTPNDGFGGMLLVTRSTAQSYAAQILARVAFIPCAGLRSDSESEALVSAFEPNSFRRVRSLRVSEPPDNSAWYVGSNWWLSTAEPEGETQ